MLIHLFSSGELQRGEKPFLTTLEWCIFLVIIQSELILVFHTASTLYMRKTLDAMDAFFSLNPPGFSSCCFCSSVRYASLPLSLLWGNGKQNVTIESAGSCSDTIFIRNIPRICRVCSRRQMKEGCLTRDLKWSRNGIAHFKSASEGTIFNASSVVGMGTIKCVRVFMVKWRGNTVTYSVTPDHLVCLLKIYLCWQQQSQHTVNLSMNVKAVLCPQSAFMPDKWCCADGEAVSSSVPPLREVQVRQGWRHHSCAAGRQLTF